MSNVSQPDPVEKGEFYPVDLFVIGLSKAGPDLSLVPSKRPSPEKPPLELPAAITEQATNNLIAVAQG